MRCKNNGGIVHSSKIWAANEKYSSAIIRRHLTGKCGRRQRRWRRKSELSPAAGGAEICFTKQVSWGSLGGNYCLKGTASWGSLPRISEDDEWKRSSHLHYCNRALGDQVADDGQASLAATGRADERSTRR